MIIWIATSMISGLILGLSDNERFIMNYYKIKSWTVGHIVFLPIMIPLLILIAIVIIISVIFIWLSDMLRPYLCKKIFK